MIPIWAAIIVGALAFVMGVSATAIIRISRKPKYNIFDAYSDFDLKHQRSQTANLVQYRHRRNHYKLKESVRYLKAIDIEIEQRQRNQRVLEIETAVKTKQDINKAELMMFQHTLDQAIKEIK